MKNKQYINRDPRAISGKISDDKVIRLILSGRKKENSLFNINCERIKAAEKEVLFFEEGSGPTVTVALPAWNGDPVIKIALESLCRQNIEKTFCLNKLSYKNKFDWELIILEEYGACASIIESYICRLKLAGCKRIIYKVLDEKMPLLDKWRQMALLSSESSDVFVLQAADCYSQPNRLFAHWVVHGEVFFQGCVWSHQSRGIFIDLNTLKLYIYDGSKESNVVTHLNMATKTNLVMNIPTYQEMKSFGISKDSRIDKFLLRSVIAQKDSNAPSCRSIIDIAEIFKNSWKKSFDTHGYNNISKTRLKSDIPILFEISKDACIEYQYPFDVLSQTKYIGRDVVALIRELSESLEDKTHE